MSIAAHTGSRNLTKVVIVALLAAFIAVMALPHYGNGQWPWLTPPTTPHINHLRILRRDGIPIPGWQTDHQEQISVGGDKWSMQQLSSQSESAATRPAVLMLRPLVSNKDQPAVEWIDLRGAQHWQVDQLRRLVVNTAPAASSEPFAVKANFFRAWNQAQTYAALQWYAWPGGGHPAPNHWFWGDQWRQWKYRQRLPWVAVTLLLPIEPLADISPHQSELMQLGQLVQMTLEQDVFR